MMLEQEYKPATPEELYNRLEQIRPTDFGQLFMPCVASEVKEGVDPAFVFKVRSKQLLAQVPDMIWDTILAVFAENQPRI